MAASSIAWRPRSQWRMHRDLYVARSDVGAVAHAHPPHCTALATCHLGIPPLHYMIAVSGGASIRCAPYHRYGSSELSLAALEAMQDRNCCLLGNHGLLVAGPNLARAMWIAEETETLAQQYVRPCKWANRSCRARTKSPPWWSASEKLMGRLPLLGPTRPGAREPDRAHGGTGRTRAQAAELGAADCLGVDRLEGLRGFPAIPPRDARFLL